MSPKPSPREAVREIVEVSLGALANLWIHAFGTRRAVVLAYHSVSQSAWAHAVTPAEFSRQLDWLASSASVVGLDAVESVAREGISSRLPVVAVTFDDGYADWLSAAAPALSSRALPATFFVTTSFQPVTSVSYPDLPVIAPEGVTRLAGMGFEIGSHGHTHRDLSACAKEELQTEIEEPRRILSSLTGRPVVRMSYPKGRYASSAFPVLRVAGYLSAFAGHGAVEKGSEPLAFPRLPVTRHLSFRRFRSRVLRAAAWGWV